MYKGKSFIFCLVCLLCCFAGVAQTPAFTRDAVSIKRIKDLSSVSLGSMGSFQYEICDDCSERRIFTPAFTFLIPIEQGGKITRLISCIEVRKYSVKEAWVQGIEKIWVCFDSDFNVMFFFPPGTNDVVPCKPIGAYESEIMYLYTTGEKGNGHPWLKEGVIDHAGNVVLKDEWENSYYSPEMQLISAYCVEEKDDCVEYSFIIKSYDNRFSIEKTFRAPKLDRYYDHPFHEAIRDIRLCEFSKSLEVFQSYLADEDYASFAQQNIVMLGEIMEVVTLD